MTRKRMHPAIGAFFPPFLTFARAEPRPRGRPSAKEPNRFRFRCFSSARKESQPTRGDYQARRGEARRGGRTTARTAQHRTISFFVLRIGLQARSSVSWTLGWHSAKILFFGHRNASSKLGLGPPRSFGETHKSVLGRDRSFPVPGHKIPNSLPSLRHPCPQHRNSPRLVHIVYLILFCPEARPLKDVQ